MSQRRDGGVHQAAHLLLARHVAGLRRRTGAGGLLELGGSLLESPFVHVAQHDGGALFGAALRGREADSGAGGSRHQHRLARQQGRAGRVGRRLRRHRGSRGSPSARSPMMLRWISLDPA